MRVAILDENNAVVNVILSNEINDNQVCVDNIRCNIGDIYQDGVFLGQKITYTLEEIISLRAEAYRNESDPIKTQIENEALYDGVEPDYAIWREKIEEIKARYPKPEE